MFEELKYIYQDVNEWLKFAEAKNAALLLFNGAALVELIRILLEANIPSLPFRIYLYVFSGCMTLGTVVLLISFIPHIESRRSPVDQPRVRFYRDISELTTESYSGVVASRYTGSNSKENMEMDLCEQIVTNSKISMRKYRYFSLGVWITISGIITPPVGLLLFIVYKD